MALARSVFPVACNGIGSHTLSASSRISSLGSLRLWQLQRNLIALQSRASKWQFPEERCGASFRGGCRQVLFDQRSSSLFVQCMSTCASEKQKQLEVSAPILVEESLATSPELQDLVKHLEEDAPRAVKLAIKGYEAAELADTTELSVTLCDDKYIRKLNKEWLGKDSPTDVISFPQNQPPGESPLLLLGDVVISVETAARQAEERSHSLLDEMRILLVHGLLHVLGHDHELSAEASEEMEKQEQQVLTSLGWKGKGLINASHTNASEQIKASDANAVFRKRKSPFKLLFCDMDGTLLNSKSKITRKTADALKAAVDVGVQVVIATGKTRYATITALRAVGLEGKGGVISTSSPGVFLQGLLVYGGGGSLVYREVLPQEYCLQAFSYSLEHRVPVVGFCGDSTVASFDDPFVRSLHEQYFEPKAKILKTLDELENHKIQKLIFYEKQERIDKFLKPQWQSITKGHATLVQAQEDMLEMLPEGVCKGGGVQRLLEHLKVDPDEVMAIGDGENDVEMLEMVGWGVAMANGATRTLEIADVTVSSNDKDGVAEAIERFILP